MNKFLKVALAVALAAVMCVSAVADTAVPSIQQKTAPEVTESTATDSDGNEVAVDTGDIVVTSYEDKDTLAEEDKTSLEEAYEQILNSESLAELEASIPEDHTAAYLFDINVTGDAKAVLDAGGSITVTLEVELGGASDVKVLHNYSGSSWREEPSSVVGTNKVQVTFSTTSPFVITVSNDSSIVVDEPVEGTVIDNGVDVSGVASSSTMPYVIGGVACIVVAGVLLVAANKKKVK